MKTSWLNFLACMLLSAAIWLFHNLSQQYADIVNVSVVPSSNIEGKAEKASSEVTVSARCKVSGWGLVAFGRDRKARKVFFDASDLRSAGDDVFTIKAANLYKYAKDIFGDDVVVESFVTDMLSMTFPSENHKKVPVLAVMSATFKPQYMANGPAVMIPDSVTIYGDKDRLASIEAVYTKQLNYKELRSSVHSDVKLEKPSGVRLSVDKATCSLDVTRFVELRSRVNIGTRNVPAHTHLTVLPSIADVTYRCKFPLNGNPVDRTEFYVDYKEFTSSIGGSCMVHCDGLPSGVIEVKIDPEVCECVAD